MSREVERLLGTGTTFTLEKAARKLARRRKPLAVVTRQRKEIDARPRGPVSDGVEYDRPAVLNHHGSRCLSSQLARFHR